MIFKYTYEDKWNYSMLLEVRIVASLGGRMNWSEHSRVWGAINTQFSSLGSRGPGVFSLLKFNKLYGQREYTSSYKMNKFWGSNIQYGDNS